MEYTEAEIAKIKAEAKEYKGFIGNLEELIDWIQECRETNNNLYYEYDDDMFFYSLVDDVESCYQRLTGLSQEEYLRQQEEKKERWNNKIKQAKILMAENSIPRWIEDGNKLIYPQKQKDWKDLIELRYDTEPFGKEFDIAITVMKSLENDEDFQKAYDIIKDNNLSGQVYSATLSLLVNFYKKGTAFYRFIDKEPTNATIKFLEKIENRNKEYEKELGI